MSDDGVSDLALVLKDGRRIQVEVRRTDRVSNGAVMWEIVMETDPDLVMPDVVKIEGRILRGHGLTVPSGPGYDTDAWGIRIFNNSPCLVSYSDGDEMARPTVGGLVSPWANVQLADGGVDFRAQHESRVQRCWREGLCQVCGHKIGRPIVLLGGPRQVAALKFDEPPLHPECAVYVSRACPMVAGRMERYASREVVADGPRGKTCYDPDCDCAGWIPTPGLTFGPGGDPAHDWYALYVSSYALGVTEDRPDRVHSAIVEPHQVLTIRHVSSPGVGRTWARTDLGSVHA